MKESEIIERATSLPGIERLNAMQLQTLESGSLRQVLIAPTGSGKTVAFGMAVLKHIGLPPGGVQAVVIAPSRELVMQIASVLRMLARGFKVSAMYGGHNMMDEVASLSPEPDIVVATPGRFLDHLQRGTLKLRGRLNALVIDEYDKALQLGFEGEMKRIMHRVGDVGFLILTSATEPEALPDYLGLSSPDVISVRCRDVLPPEVIQVESFSKDKIDTLVALLKSGQAGYKTVVFVNHRESAERVCGYLKRKGVRAGLYHGALDQQQRILALSMFANGTTPVLVATDLAARGLDITSMSSVIHYHLPVDEAAWTHRNGRVGRQTGGGKVFVITSEADNVAPYMSFDRPYQPNGAEGDAEAPAVATIYINAGKKEKISRGDVLGFIVAKGDADGKKVGRIDVFDHFSIAALPAEEARGIAEKLDKGKIKGRKVKVSLVSR